MQRLSIKKHRLILAGVGMTGAAVSNSAWALVIQIPEPSTLSLFGAAAVVAVVLFRLKNRK